MPNSPDRLESLNEWQPLIRAIDGLSLPVGTRVLVATSGGPDSVALAVAFRSANLLGSESQWELRLGHVNHCLRGSYSDDDESFVHDLGRRLALVVDSARVDTATYAAENRLSVETAARELRYRELERMLRAWGGDVIAMGHHADDQAETMLMNLVRGAGLDGLTGMSPQSGTIVRPFLHLSKGSIATALLERGESYRFDRSNEDLAPRRNFFRHRVLSALREVRPDVATALARTADLLRTDAAYLNDEAKRALAHLDVRVVGQDVRGSTGVFRSLQRTVQARVLRLLVAALTGDTRDLSEEHVVLMSDTIATGQEARELGTQLPHGLRLIVDSHTFHLYRGTRGATSIGEPVEWVIPGIMHTPLGSFEAVVDDTVADRHSLEKVVCGPNHALCDADALGGRLTVRSRRPGDRVHLRSASGSKKLQDLLVDAKIPRTQRDSIPVIENEDFIAWIPGFGVDHRVALRPETRRVAHLGFRPFS